MISLFASLVALTLSSSTISPVHATTCYTKGGICYISGSSKLTINTVVADYPLATCITAVFDCATSTHPACTATCASGVYSMFMSAVSNTTIASYQKIVDSDIGTLFTCTTDFCNAPKDNYLPMYTKASSPVICYSGTHCQNGAGTFSTLNSSRISGAKCATVSYDCTTSNNPSCSKCSGGILTDFISVAGNDFSIQSSIKMNGGALNTCDSTDYCNKPTFQSISMNTSAEAVQSAYRSIKASISPKNNAATHFGPSSVITMAGIALAAITLV